ncbi:UNVERIFIED_CONTAM: hypothetical protein Sradi_6896200 [Sesamum radiatum]|uniref:Uncharacterized protein n=2 Tax=Sesamum TaxID=4181 RepID=A0AAW2JI92_SESRA
MRIPEKGGAPSTLGIRPWAQAQKCQRLKRNSRERTPNGDLKPRRYPRYMMLRAKVRLDLFLVPS